MTITLDGLLVDWTAADRLETSVTQFAGYEVYGRVESDTFYFALSSALPIGANTTFWLNTDGDPRTGYQVFGAYTGAEFYINFDAGGVPRLYNALTNLLVSVIDYALSADLLSIEIALPRSLLGPAVTSVSFVADINDSIFLPGSYASGQYTLVDPSAPSQFDGVLSEWLPSQRLDLGFTNVSGYEVYGKFANDAFIFGVKSAVDIGVASTFWFNTDQNSATGYQVFGSASGAEFNLNIGGDGIARLYSGGAGQTFIGNIDYKIAIDGKSIEFALPKSMIGTSVTTVRMMADINDSVFLPADYTYAPYSLTDRSSLPPPAANGYRIAIVYSETTAANYFGDMPYSQLFMAAQSQAMAAGIPFDILSESDLTNVAALSGYDAIVFPSFQNVPSNYAAIETALTDLVNNYHIPLITAGNFMTSDASGAALSGNAYARMQSLLGVTITGSGSGAVTLNASDHQIVHDFGSGGLIHSYANIGTLYFDFYGSEQSTIIAQQTVGGISHNAVLGTVTGGRNVHFATDGFLADNNLLGQALDWVTEATAAGPQLSLHMTRDEAIVASRTDVDQAMETVDVNGGILTSLTSILAQWKAAYNFVGSYYVDIGLYGPDQVTNWAVSKPYYDQILALGNEIGSHSFSHPENTNLLLPDVITQELLDQRKAAYAELYPSPGAAHFTPYSMRDDAQQSVINTLASMTVAQINAALVEARAAPDPYALDLVHKALLEATYSFQFATSKQLLEQQLGITITGAAVPGAPESHATASEIIQYYNYLSGGGSLIGAGYPGAIGYLSPTETNQVYIAPNMSFDFTLVGFQGLTAAQAQAAWISEFNTLMNNSDMPIVVWPWHDYGPTQWMVDPPANSPYTLAMYTNFIQTAYNAGAEFVTLDDLARRVNTFNHTALSYTVSGDTITATVTPQTNNLGTFALDFESLGTQQIKSVAGWYAYDQDSVFMDADGGTFQIQLGAAIDDVSHITSIGQRAKLMSISGDGTNLAFTIVGEGKVVVDLKLVAGWSLSVTGATYSLAGEILTLTIGSIGSHDVSVQQTAPANTAPTDITVSGLTELPENSAARTLVATLAAVDNDVLPESRNNIITVSDARFEYDSGNGGLYLKAGQTVNFEIEPSILLTLTATDAGNTALTYSEQLTVIVADVNEAVTGLAAANQIALAENTAVRTKVADIAITDPDTAAAFRNNLITSSDARFEYDAGDGGLYLRAGQLVDFETQPLIALTLTAADAGNAALNFSIPLTFTVLNGNDGLGVLSARVVSMERASTDTPLNLTVPADPDGDVQSFVVSVLPTAGALRLAGAAVTAGQTLTLAQFQALTYSFPDVAAQDIAMTILVDDGHGHLDPLSVVLRVTAGVNSVLSGTAGADRLDGAFGDDTLNGLGGNDTLIGGIGNDTMDGGIGTDTMLGGAGNDRYYVDSASDQALETAGNGSDTVYASVNYALSAGQQIETLSARTQTSTAALNLTGNEIANTLLGSAGINILDGGAGADKLYGLAGNDTYYVDNAADQVFETAGNGTDTVYSSVSYALLAGQQVEVLSARDTASVAALILTGNEFTNTLIGNAGANTLDGKAGADAMNGGAGDDLYVVDNSGDVITEGAGQGTLDRVTASVSYSLAAGVQVESLATTSAGGTTAINLTGNEFAQSITGNAGANIIDGKGGADAMAGGAGNDFYNVDNTGDSIVETANQGTLDQVAASISYTLAAGVQVESLATTSAAGTGVLNLTGNEYSQSITGNAGANTLNGKGGTDTLTGGLGSDIFVFNTALGASNVDTVTDFDVVQDRIWLDDLIFTALPSLFTADQFAINATGLAQDSSDRVIYQTTTGFLFYDSNGTAAGGATQFATLAANLAVTFSDFIVV